MDKEDFLKQCAKTLNIISKDELYAVFPPKESNEKTIQCWLQLIPSAMMKQLELALAQELCFLSNDLITEHFVEKNSHLTDHSQLTILYSILVYALEWDCYKLASAIVFLVDRASYRYGNSKQLMNIVDFIWQMEPDTRIVPQVIVRRARLMKDSGNLHGAMQILDALVKKQVYKWDYKSEIESTRVTATCIQIKGQIYHNLGLWKDAMPYLVESAEQLMSIKDYKGVSYSHGLITKCLPKLTMDEYDALKVRHPSFFEKHNPCYEGYRISVMSVELLEKLKNIDHLFSAKHQLSGNECLLMYADQQTVVLERYSYYQTIIADMKKCLALHDDANLLKGIESFYEFIKAVFMISQTLSFSRLPQDRSLSRYLEQLSIELYAHLCTCPDDRNLDHNKHSVKLMNGALNILGLPTLRGTDSFMQKETPVNDTKMVEDNLKIQVMTVSLHNESRHATTSDSLSPSAQLSTNSDKLFQTNFPRKFVGLSVNPHTFCSSDDFKDDFDGGYHDMQPRISQSLVDISWKTVSGSNGYDPRNLPNVANLGIKSNERESSEITSLRSEPGISTESQSIFSGSTASLFSAETTEEHCTDDDHLEPLIDISSPKVHEQFEELQLGTSSSTDSSSSSLDYLLNWQLPNIDVSSQSANISRAHILTYNPVNNEWKSNSTLAFIGPELQLGNMKGSFRDVFDVKFLHQDEPLGRYVCKRYRRQKSPVCYMQDIICQMVAGYYVTMFNEALANHRTKFSVQFLPVAHLQLLTSNGVLKDWVNVEPFLHGQFNKLTNNLSYVNKAEADIESTDLATALSHFSYVKSNGTLMIVDIQGWLPVNESGIIYLTDPQFHTSCSVQKFSNCDHKEKGMDKFWKQVHEKCNGICQLLNLERPITT
ncbi:alpha-protein kinase 1 [Patella vulgata]|uniref:alpha-protein kinase 1 n=1 Tax=Patella vulgata TaxID=6465 RepID=UPI0024A9EC88|nr:alpha-protein kinase 1 [Patella vulgata]XP_055959423.1 alpha-protein kinase 1 [Patella vulgata]